MPSYRRLTALCGLTMAISFVVAHAALASQDDCEPRLFLKGREANGCSCVPFLSPANDSRVNFMLLLTGGGRVTIDASWPDYRSGGRHVMVPFPLYAVTARYVPAAGEEQTGTATVPEKDTKTLRELATMLGLEVAEPRETDLFAKGEGSRWRSNTDDSARAFLGEVVSSAGIPEEERRDLARARLALLEIAWDKSAFDRATPPASIASPLGKQFATYLGGAVAFYRGQFDDARRAFESLRDSPQPWLAETSRYMVARAELNRAQQPAFNEYGYPSLDRVDRAALDASEAAFNAYLHDHPSGRYAGSARGLLRRVYWLMQDRRRLAYEYTALLDHPDPALPSARRLECLAEIDGKLLSEGDPDGVEDPRFLAVMDLMAMRYRNDATSGRLEAQRPLFASNERLADYLRSAALFYAEGDADRTLQSLPGGMPTAPLDVVAFSQQTLRGFALEAKGDWDAARTHWRALLPLTARPLQHLQVELAFALNCERSGRVADVFAADSPVEAAEYRRMLLEHAAGPALLRARAASPADSVDERDVALLTLLAQELRHGRYHDFVADLGLMPKTIGPVDLGTGWNGIRNPNLAVFAWRAGKLDSGYTCPTIRNVAVTMQRTPKAPVALNCLGEFMLRAGFDEWSDQRPRAEELGGFGRPPFEGPVYSRLDGYLQVMGDARASRDDRAYATYRALNCFANSGNNHCGAQEVPVSTRRRWFRTLKGRYAATPWAKDQKVYW